MVDTAESVVASVPIDRLAADAAPDYGVDTSKMKGDLTKIAKEQAPIMEEASNRQLRAINDGRSDILGKYDAIKPLDVKPWDADKERADRVQSPLEAFGSLAGVFAMLASAFTKTPMDNALNAGAAAINSVRANDFDGYNKAHEAHKENLELALKRHETERAAFADAVMAYKNDPIAGGAELKAVAARFGAKAELAMIEAGFVEKAFDIQKAKADAAQKLLGQMPALAELDEKTRTRFLADKAIKEEEKKLGRPLDGVEQAKIIGNIRRLTQQNLGTFTGARQEALAIQDRADELIREAQARGETLTSSEAYTRAAREVGQNKASMTGGQIDKLRGHVDQFDLSLGKVDDIMAVLEKNIGAAGLAARPLRLKERVWNIFGSNETDRVQMMRDLQYLRMAGSRLLTDSSAKPLAAEANRVDAIIAGLEAGDTGANTIRALEELKKIYAKMRTTTLSRINGTWKPEGGEAAPGAPGAAPPRGNPWDNDAIIR